jgi:hypothetical protein
MRVTFLAGARDLSPLCSVMTGSEAYPASYPFGTWGFFPGDKWPGHETDHSTSSGAMVENDGAEPPTYLHGMMLN